MNKTNRRCLILVLAASLCAWAVYPAHNQPRIVELQANTDISATYVTCYNADGMVSMTMERIIKARLGVGPGEHCYGILAGNP